MLSEKLKRRLFCVFYLAIILWLTPLCIFWSLVFWLFGRKKYEENLLPGHLRRRILITGDTATKAVHIIRALGKAGHTVIIADWVGPWSVLRWSRYVSKVYSVSSNQTEYVQQVINIGVHEKVDYFIPVIKKDYAMADARIGEYLTQQNIKCLVSNPTQIKQLDEKIDFMRKCKEYGLSVPEFVDSEEKLYSMASDGYFQDRFFFFKPSACSSVFRNSFERIPADLTQIKNFMKSFRDEIFFAQEYIHGTELSANLLSKDGEIVQLNLAHSSPIQVDYDVIQHPKITKWVTDFCRKTNLTGAVCFDFIEDKMGDIYCLECNPRFHSSLVNYIDTKSFERSLLSLFEETQLHFSKPLHPNPNIFTYWFYQEFFRMLTLKRSMMDFFKILAFGYEALWDSSDPIPYIVYHHAQIPVSLMKHILTGEYWECVNFCLGRVMY